MKGHKGFCDECGKEVTFLFKPDANLPKYCKKCHIRLSLKQIKHSIKSLISIEDNDKLEDTIKHLVFTMSRTEIKEVKRIKIMVKRMITKVIKDENKRDKIFILLAREEKRNSI